MGVVALNTSSSSVPDLDSAILGTGDHPFALAMEGYARDVSRMAIEGENGAWICRVNVIELDIVVSSCGKVTLVGRDAQAVDLRIRMLNGTRAYTRKGFPESNGMVITRYLAVSVKSTHR